MKKENLLLDSPTKEKSDFTENNFQKIAKKITSKSTNEIITFKHFSNQSYITPISFLLPQEQAPKQCKRSKSNPLRQFYPSCLLSVTNDHYNQLLQKINDYHTLYTFKKSQVKERQKKIMDASIQNDFLKKQEEEYQMKLILLQRKTEVQKHKSLLKIKAIKDMRSIIQEKHERIKQSMNKIIDAKQNILQNIDMLKSQIINVENESHALASKEIDLIEYDKTLTNQINTIDDDISKSIKKRNDIQQEVVQLQNTLQEQNKVRLEGLRQIQILKPYYKKFLVLRTNNSSSLKKEEEDEYIPLIEVDKFRKNLSLTQTTQYTYDYIISKITNPYLETIINEETYIDNELTNAFIGYISLLSSPKQHCFVLYITRINYIEMNETLTNMLNLLIVQYPTWIFNVKVLFEGMIINEIDKEKNFKSQIDDMNSCPISFIYEMKDKNTNRKVCFCHTQFDNQEINSILFLLNDFNHTQTKKKIKSLNEYSLLNEVIDLDPFYSLVIIDVNCREIKTDEVMVVMNGL